MEVIIQPTPDAAARLVVELIDQVVRQNPSAVLGFATGRTMESVYDKLYAKHVDEGLDFSGCSTFNLDEYIGLDAGDPHSYRHYMNERLFSRIEIDLANTYLPDGTAADIDAECVAYEKKIEAMGGIDLQLLGIGASGHIGFNEPLSALRSRTRAKALTPTTREQNAPMFDSIDEVPKRAITMGVGTILDTRRCILLATGASKAKIIAKAVEGPITSMISASALQLHPHCTIVVDEEAAAELEQTDYYHWIFQNEPEWEEFRNC
ncbi:MAG: glucosamine-6-phosphate deaminase [Candidatus Hydrogenedentota bacterium]